MDLTFDDASSVNDWVGVANATDASEASITWNAMGNGTGSMELSGINSGTPEGGRAYIFEYRRTDFDYQGAETLIVSFDIKIDNALNGTNLQFQSQVPITPAGVYAPNNLNIDAGLTLGTWENIEFTITNDDFDNTGNFLLLFFNIAAGAFMDAGGTFQIDNLKVISPITLSTVDLEKEASKINIAPNPARAGADVTTTENATAIEVYSVAGSLVKSVEGSTVNTSGLTSGVYILRITTESGATVTKKLIVQ